MNNMGQVFRIVLLLNIATSCTSNSDGDHHVSGKIVDSKTKEPIGQVSVLLQHKDPLNISGHFIEGAIANSEGVYSLAYEGNLEDCVLYFGMVGYKPKVVENLSVSKMPLDVELQIDTAEHVDFIPE
ncbi:hypothetical protein [Algoriphagus persicinus]|uniref:hypothetical protein n=1 Tax=Algoriphagus persicinus TaxID=3108754 RepID=UPI002B395C7A|nr:hypothetical protein [Algoriphagus sp. E1-3-M2]MEB2787363.1 hypothetical protein [Algoriphagus sp. E1-3-M2]